MLKNLVEDSEEIEGEELFVAFLRNHTECETKSVHFVCCENPPEFYLKDINTTNIIVHNFFCDPCGWDSNSTFDINLGLFTANSVYSDAVVFLDSLSSLTRCNELGVVYKWLWDLKSAAKKVICLAHGDTFSPLHFNKFRDLSTTFIALQPTIRSDHKKNNNLEEKFVNIIHKKSGDKVVNQREIYFIDSELKITSEIDHSKQKLTTVNKNVIENLTTFKIKCDNKEKKDEFIFPFLKPKNHIPYTGKIIYKPEAGDDLEDDPDDDLNI